MANGSCIEISRQRSSVDVEELRVFLSEHAQSVTVQDVQPGPQASVDWFLPATVDLVMNLGAAHSFVAGLLGSVAAKLPR
jgi:hypothetical protein